MKAQSKISILLLVSVVLIQNVVYQFNGTMFAESSGSHDANAMWVEPANVTLSNCTVSLGFKFNITIWLNITSTNVWGYQIALLYNRTQLKCTRAGWTRDATSAFMEGHDVVHVGPVIDTSFFGNGSIAAYECCRGYYYVTVPNANSTLWAEFEIIAMPSENGSLSSKFDITTWYPSETFVADLDLIKIDITTYDGIYTINTVPPIRDVAVTDVYVSQNFAPPGDIINVQVDVANNGNIFENFGVTAYADAETAVIGDEIIIGTQTAALPGPSSATLFFSWDTTGLSPANLTVSGKAQTVPDDINTTNNLFIDGVVQIQTPVHDVAVTDVRVSKNNATRGDIIGIEVDVINNGNVAEVFNVTAYADAETTIIGDETLVGSQTTYLPGGNFTTLFFYWDTTNAIPGNLTVSAKAQTIPGETNTINNQFIDGVVRIDADVPDIAVTDIRLLEEAAYAGDIIQIEVGLQNQGNAMVKPTVTLYADANTAVIGDEVVVDIKTITLGRYSSGTIAYGWDTTGLAAGNYTLTAVATPLPDEVDLEDNNKTNGVIQLFVTVPCPDVNVTCPTSLTVNPSIFTYNPGYQARLINIGNVSINSTGFEGDLRVVGSRNGTIRLCVGQPDLDVYPFYLPLNGEVQVPLWLMFQPETHWETYNGNFTLNLTVCGTHRKVLTIVGISITVCQNGAYIVENDTVTFTWNLTGGSLVYLEAETDLPPGWTYSVDPPIGTFFETPQIVTVNITAPPDAKEGDTGRVTLRAYKNATGTMIWQFIYFASTDNKPPTIESVETPTLTPDGHLIFNATVKDLSGIAQVLLHYSVDGAPWENTTMQWVSGDTFNSTDYTVEKAFETTAHTLQYYVSATDWFSNETSSDIRTVSIVNDVAITEVSVGEINITDRYSFDLNVTVANQGTLPSSFVNIALYANSSLLATKPVFNLQNGTSTILTFSLNLSESDYIMTAFAPPLAYETSTADNAKHLENVLHLINDVAATNIAFLKTVVNQGYCMQVNATVTNQGGFTEVFNVTLKAGTSIVQNRTITMASGNVTTLILTWNTSGFAKGYCAISIYIQSVPHETDTADNTFVGEYVTVSMVGDLTGSTGNPWDFISDGKVDGSDLIVVSRCFGSSPASPPSMKWHPNCDITNDNVIDGSDLIIVARHYGETDP
jgi:hypothetical protein